MMNNKESQDANIPTKTGLNSASMLRTASLELLCACASGCDAEKAPCSA